MIRMARIGLRLRGDRLPGADGFEKPPRPLGDCDGAQERAARVGGWRRRRIDDGDRDAGRERPLDRGRERKPGGRPAGDDDVEDGRWLCHSSSMQRRIVGFLATVRNEAERRPEAGILPAKNVGTDCVLGRWSAPGRTGSVFLESSMSKALIIAVVLAGLPALAFADENNPVSAGANAGAAAGGAVGGAVGAVVGAPLGAAAGIVGGLTGAMAPRFHHYVVEQDVPSYTWEGHPHVVVGEVLPAEGVTLYPVPPQYGVTRYQYTVVDNTPVLVDPSTRRVVEVVP